MIPGNSGYELCFLTDTVIKGSAGRDPTRLKKSCQTQSNFKSDYVNTPRVFHSEESPGGFSFIMDRIEGTTIFHANIDDCLRQLFCYIQDNLNHSHTGVLTAELFIDKIYSIDGVEKWPEAEALAERFRIAEQIYLPCGPMHGDLTLCNILCTGSAVWLIDFLDGFLSSPVFDVAKLRQDSYHGWIETFEECPRRDYVDRLIMHEFGNLPWLKELTLLALLRIIPYTRGDQRVINFLQKEIPRAYACLDSSGT